MTFLARYPAAAPAVRKARRVAVAVIGFSVLTLGVVFIVLPGPAVLVIPLGLAILATEFLWARKLLRPVRKFLQRTKIHARRMLDSTRA